ncbi:MAG: hypothetical protein CMJ31_07500 [Phycisphaerae bacterium]|nr:hypothetical protein [Phycisphaerae bacterium]
MGVVDRFPLIEQVECRRTHTTVAGHEAIRANLHRAPMFSGQIASTGPRYCPSIEDKVVRFADRESHGVFLEPESLRDEWVYCNGISSSLPADVQDVVVRSMPGCERAEILRYGYAVEYDMSPARQIHATGETKLVGGLFFAGQINGTSGYEEAAAQGLVAGVNAARRAVGEDADFTLGRDEAYIGVLMDDLVTKTPVEPYRMFTSRAEHRLLLRSDNAPDRLTPIAERLGLLDGTALGRRRLELFRRRRATLDEAARLIDAAAIGGRFGGADFGVAELGAIDGFGGMATAELMTAWAERHYEPYVRRQLAEIKRSRAMEEKRAPAWLDYRAIDGLRAEAREALVRFRPATFGQAGRLEGVTPADLSLIMVYLRKNRGRSGASA